MNEFEAKIERWKEDASPSRWRRWRGKIIIPEHCHPLVQRFLQEANQQLTTLQEIADRAGLSRTAISDWKTNRNPSISNFDAALNVLGLELYIRRRRESR